MFPIFFFFLFLFSVIDIFWEEGYVWAFHPIIWCRSLPGLLAADSSAPRLMGKGPVVRLGYVHVQYFTGARVRGQF